MDAFFASVEKLDNPDLEGRPVIVGGLGRRGVVATASYEAREYGVKSAMPISKARKLCPDGIYLLPRFERYQEISRKIQENGRLKPPLPNKITTFSTGGGDFSRP